jgi:hypothetical protein
VTRNSSHIVHLYHQVSARNHESTPCQMPTRRAPVARHTSHVTRHTSHVTRHTSHVTRHLLVSIWRRMLAQPIVHCDPANDIMLYKLHVTRHTSHVTRSLYLQRLLHVHDDAGILPSNWHCRWSPVRSTDICPSLSSSFLCALDDPHDSRLPCTITE